MKIWLIERSGSAGYDSYRAHVIVAASAKKARKMASEMAAGEGAASWLDTSWSTCRAIGDARPAVAEGVVLSRYNAG